MHEIRAAPSNNMTPRSESARNVKPATLVRRRALFEEARHILEREFASELRLEPIAKRISTSRRQLQRAFAEAGTSFAVELLRVRVERASELLRSSDLHVSTVAQRVGYRQASQFAKAFRRHTGQSPAQFRSSVRAEAVLPRAA